MKFIKPVKKLLFAVATFTIGGLFACGWAFALALLLRCIARAWLCGWRLFAILLLFAAGHLPLLAVPVEFPLLTMFGGTNYTRAFRVDAVNSTVTDGTNQWVGSSVVVTPHGGTNPIVELTPNDYLVTFQDARTPWRIRVPNQAGLLNAVIQTIGPLPSFWWSPNTINLTQNFTTTGGGGSATNVNFSSGNNIVWRQTFGGSNIADVVGTITNDTTGTAHAALSVSTGTFNTNIIGHWWNWGFAQGMGYDTTLNHWVINGTAQLSLWDDNRTQYGSVNSAPFSGLPGGTNNYTHTGDGDCFAGYYFVPAEKYSSPNGYNAVIAVYNTTNLAFASWQTISNQMPEIATLAVNPLTANTATLYAMGQNATTNYLYTFSITGTTNITFVSSNLLSGMPNELSQGMIFAGGKIYACLNNSTNGSADDIWQIDPSTYASTFLGQVIIPNGNEGEGATYHDGCLVLAEGHTGTFYWFNLGLSPTVSTNGTFRGANLVGDLPKGGVLNPNQVSTNTVVDGRSGNIFGVNNVFGALGLGYPFMVFNIDNGGGGAFPSISEGPQRFGNIADQLVLGSSFTKTNAPSEPRKHFFFGTWYGDFGINNSNPVATVDIKQTTVTPGWQTNSIVSITPSAGNAANKFQVTDTNGNATFGVASNDVVFGNGGNFTNLTHSTTLTSTNGTVTLAVTTDAYGAKNYDLAAIGGGTSQTNYPYTAITNAPWLTGSSNLNGAKITAATIPVAALGFQVLSNSAVVTNGQTTVTFGTNNANTYNDGSGNIWYDAVNEILFDKSIPSTVMNLASHKLFDSTSTESLDFNARTLSGSWSLSSLKSTGLPSTTAAGLVGLAASGVFVSNSIPAIFYNNGNAATNDGNFNSASTNALLSRAEGTKMIASQASGGGGSGTDHFHYYWNTGSGDIGGGVGHPLNPYSTGFDSQVMGTLQACNTLIITNWACVAYYTPTTAFTNNYISVYVKTNAISSSANIVQGQTGMTLVATGSGYDWTNSTTSVTIPKGTKWQLWIVPNSATVGINFSINLDGYYQ